MIQPVAGATVTRKSAASRALTLVGVAPVLLVPTGVWLIAHRLAPWILMWALSIAIFASLKWLTWWQVSRRIGPCSGGRSLAYLFLWPGMDAAAFLGNRPRPSAPSAGEVIAATGSVALGAALFWGAPRLVRSADPLIVGWVGLLGLIFLLHFGAFHLASVFWRWRGIEATPLMRAPIAARSLGEFWGTRWNTAFHILARDYIVAPLRLRLGIPLATMAAFAASGLVHEVVISLPVRAGFGLPMGYFLLQGLGVLAERSAAGRRLHLGRGFRGHLLTLLMAGAPAFGLFHPMFVLGVVIPFMHWAGAQ